MSVIRFTWVILSVSLASFHAPILFASETAERLNAGLAALKREHYATALRSWLPLAQAGDSEAQANVGYMYEEGLGVSQQFDVAIDWYEKAAASGSMQAQHNLGMMWAEGRGVSQSWVRALRHFETAADTVPASRYMIGYTFFQGEGNIQNRGRAFREFMNAASDGYADAQYMLAFMYLDGASVPRQPLQAFVWARLAQENDQQQAAELVEAASNRVSASQLRRAQAMVEMCLTSGLDTCVPSISALE